MNVIIANEQRDVLSNLDIDIIKSIYGEYDANEIVEMFKNFFYNRMILDVTAIKNFRDIENFKIIASGLDAEKIIFFLPKGTEVCTSNFISNLVTNGIYNFTTNVDGVKYLLNKPNTFKDVANLKKEERPETIVTTTMGTARVIGFRNLTEKAGTTTLIYMLKKELNSQIRNRVVAIESDKNDFSYFNENDMISVETEKLRDTVYKYSSSAIVLVDLNKSQDDSFCGEVIYLLEPSMIGINKLIKRNRNIFNKMSGKKIVLNKSMLTNKDVNDFEFEAKTKIFYNIPPLDERKKNNVLGDFLGRLGLLEIKDNGDGNNNRIFGLFRR
ncbi:MAG: hypothetical protein E7160_01340 [Firmicutes bacterium]|nr:hypothetical protein [Bacillota bacterium]